MQHVYTTSNLIINVHNTVNFRTNMNITRTQLLHTSGVHMWLLSSQMEKRRSKRWNPNWNWV